MEELNRTLFLLINASADSGILMLNIAKFLANDVIWLIPAVLLLGWLCGEDRLRKTCP